MLGLYLQDKGTSLGVFYFNYSRHESLQTIKSRMHAFSLPSIENHIIAYNN